MKDLTGVIFKSVPQNRLITSTRSGETPFFDFREESTVLDLLALLGNWTDKDQLQVN